MVDVAGGRRAVPVRPMGEWAQTSCGISQFGGRWHALIAAGHQLSSHTRPGDRAPAGRSSIGARSPRLDALDGAPAPDSQSHVEHDAAVRRAPDRVEVGLDYLGDLPEQQGEAQGQLAQRRTIERSGAPEPVQLSGNATAGGTGKTRLAVEAAAALRAEYQDGAWLIELASVAAPDGAGPAVAGALGAVASALGSPQPPGSAVQLIVRHLAGRSLVVVLDNCEHVIAEAAALADTLAGAVPGLRLIATSREALGIPGEVLVPVGGLAIPAAAELFADRARAVQPGFLADGPAGDVIKDICRRLDGLPLAVELAAARLRALPLATVAERLDDRFRLLTGGARTALPRQQTLRAVVDWSYDLLFEDERRLFARLAAFTGGCDLAAAEAICADDQVPAGEILDVLSLAGRQVPRHWPRRRW